MEEPLSLTLLYTGGIAGDLALLPRLYTFLQRLKGDGRHCLLLDLGGSCSDIAWHCRDTGGRSALIVLDGMGYHAANAEGVLETEDRDKLAGQVTMGLVDRRNHWRCRMASAMEIIAALRPVEPDERLQIMLEPAESTRLDGKVLRLQAVGRGQVGEVAVDMRGEPVLVSSCIRNMPADTPPNPSIAGAVEFVESEARYYRRRGP